LRKAKIRETLLHLDELATSVKSGSSVNRAGVITASYRPRPFPNASSGAEFSPATHPGWPDAGTIVDFDDMGDGGITRCRLYRSDG
jgi:hypothetical protein